MKVVFINQILTSCAISALAKKAEMVVIVPKKIPPRNTPPKTARLIKLTRTTFGIQSLKKLLLPKNQTGIPQYMPKLGAVLRREKPDMIFATEIYQFFTWQCISYVRRNNVRLFIFSETKSWPRLRLAQWFLKLSLWYMRRNLPHIEKIIVWTEQGREFYARHFPEANVVLIPASVDTTLFAPVSDKSWLPDNRLRILMNARFLAFKRHKDLLEAVARLRERGSKLSVSLIGSGELGREDIIRQIENFGLQDVVTLLDPRPHNEMPLLYHQHDVLVLPSYNEAIGMVVPEAMACGVPTITSDTTGANVYVKDGETGWVFKTGDVDDLVSKLEECFAEEQLQQMAAAARKHSENFSKKEISKKILQVVFQD